MAKKRKPKEQAVIAEEATQQQQKSKLRQQISTLRRLPHDFRDIDPGSKNWEDFAEITGKRKEMEAWANGPVIYFGTLNSGEKMVLGEPNKLIHYDCRFDDDWQHIINTANFVEKASWIYLPDEKLKVIVAFNALFSRFGFNVRARGPVMSAHSGKRIGVVH